MSEEQLKGAIIDAAHAHRWIVAHFRAAKTERGWRTPVEADGKGFPDLVLAHPDRGVLFIECKADRGRLSAEQERWVATLGAALSSAPDGEVWVARPDSLGAVIARLARKGIREVSSSSPETSPARRSGPYRRTQDASAGRGTAALVALHGAETERG